MKLGPFLEAMTDDWHSSFDEVSLSWLEYDRVGAASELVSILSDSE
jgi:hypothetical protein